MDLHPGEIVVFEGHPSWRAVLGFYIGGIAGALAIAVIVALVVNVALGVLAGLVLIALVLVVGVIRRWATDYMVSNQRLYIRTAGTDDSDFRFVGISSPVRVAEAVDRALREAAAR